MSLQRYLNEKIYEWNRKKIRQQTKKNHLTFDSPKMPQIIGFRVENNQVEATIHSENKGTTRKKRKRREGNIELKKIIGIILVAIGCILLLTRCMGKKEKPTEIKKAETTYFKSYIQDFNIVEEDLKFLLDFSKKYEVEFAHTLGVWALESYQGVAKETIIKKLKDKKSTSGLDDFGLYEDARNVYKQFIYDIEVFPIENKKLYTYENTWRQERHYKEARQHYGTDLMAHQNKSGIIEIRSITSGVVENIGWNELGGYRVGIRSSSGAYFYYAHLHEEPSFLKKGDWVKAGDKIGMMGNTGYGQEGTRDKFPVHLHIGVAVEGKDKKEYWINPYYLLRYLEKYGS